MDLMREVVIEDVPLVTCFSSSVVSTKELEILWPNTLTSCLHLTRGKACGERINEEKRKERVRSHELRVVCGLVTSAATSMEVPDLGRIRLCTRSMTYGNALRRDGRVHTQPKGQNGKA